MECISRVSGSSFHTGSLTVARTHFGELGALLLLALSAILPGLYYIFALFKYNLCLALNCVFNLKWNGQSSNMSGYFWSQRPRDFSGWCRIDHCPKFSVVPQPVALVYFSTLFYW